MLLQLPLPADFRNNSNPPVGVLRIHKNEILLIEETK